MNSHQVFSHMWQYLFHTYNKKNIKYHGVIYDVESKFLLVRLDHPVLFLMVGDKFFTYKQIQETAASNQGYVATCPTVFDEYCQIINDEL